VAGQGQNFCAGIDMGYLQRNFAAITTTSAPGTAPGTVSEEAAAGGAGAGGGRGGEAAICPGAQRAAMRRNILALQEAYSELERCRSPVLAAVHGATGRGALRAMLQSVRRASERSRPLARWAC
jgi:enoyl-CoA hydratase/carnithine racemase